jgi:hypothetical protein
MAFTFSVFGLQFRTAQSDTGFQSVEVTKDLFYKNLPVEVNESSGLIFWDGFLWTHNDGGGKEAIYGIDTMTGKIERTVFLKGAKNFDWEDIAKDDGYIYVGDFGNNSGTRRGFFVYKIAKGGVTSDKNEVFVQAQQIGFTYADQESFKKQQHAHNYDCEAFFAFEDQLYLFTKNWADQKTRLYKMPKKLGMYHLQPEATFDAGGLVTGADISPEGDRVALIGYIDFVPFMWLLWDFEGDDFFGGKKLRVNFPEMVFVQTEGIVFTSNNELLFSCEESAEAPSVFKVLFSDLIRDKSLSVDAEEAKIIVPGEVVQTDQNEIRVSFEVYVDAGVTVELLDTRWKVVGEKTITDYPLEQPDVSFDIKGLKPGTYFLNFKLLDNPDTVIADPSRENSIVKKIEIK